MASKTVVEWVDDIDGGPATETVSFALDGVEYEIDLSTEHATQLRTALTEFIRKARPENAAPSRTGAAVEDEEEPGLLPTPATAESSRHLPAPRSAIKSRISATQLAMDVEGFDEPPKPARTTRKAAAKAVPAASTKEGPARVAPAKTTAAKTTAKTTAAKQAPAAKPAAEPEAEPAAKAPAKQQAPAAKQQAAEPKSQQAPAAKTPPAPAPKAAPEPAAVPEPEPKQAAEPQRTNLATPFSQPEQPRVTKNAGKDGQPRPPMITFSSAKP
ncbi:MAG TPA: Lsr2 family protein [Pseudonocardiaceae bacterium]|nr:Lsr2 family protein [Pseudonocardiaceae bacterium]